MDKQATLTIPTHNQPSAGGGSVRRRSTKKHGFQNILRAILYMIKSKSDKKAQVDVASKGTWKKLVGAMRPLHHNQLPQTHSPSRPPPPPPIDIPSYVHPQLPPPSPNVFLDVIPSPNDRYGLASPSISDGGRSRYASALNLQELDKSDDQEADDIEDMIEDGSYEDGGDLAIDAKAEEFIANFYEQMRLQRLETA